MITRHSKQNRESGPAKQHEDQRRTKGVSILDFHPESIAKDAGLEENDVIIEYYGVGELTSTKLAALTMTAKPREGEITVICVRDGNSFPVTLPLGRLGISALDVVVEAPLSPPDALSERPSSSLNRLVESIKSELVEGTCRSTLIKTLVRNGWTRREASIFVNQVYQEMWKDPGYVRSALDDGALLVLIALAVIVRPVVRYYCHVS